MRGWVGVIFEVLKKMPGSLSIQGLGVICVEQPPAHLTLSWFQRFSLLTQFLKWTIIRTSAQPNLENYIYLGFQDAAVATLNNPY